MNLTLDNLITENDNFSSDDLEWVFRRIDYLEKMPHGIFVIDWEVIGIGNSRQIGILFDKVEKRYGYYSDNGETVLVELDKTYQELSDWGAAWDNCPEVLQFWD